MDKPNIKMIAATTKQLNGKEYPVLFGVDDYNDVWDYNFRYAKWYLIKEREDKE